VFELERKKKEDQDLKQLIEEEEKQLFSGPVEIGKYTEEEEKQHEEKLLKLRERKGQGPQNMWKMLE